MDKGRTTAIMYTNKYTSHMETILGDKNTHEIIEKKNPESPAKTTTRNEENNREIL